MPEYLAGPRRILFVCTGNTCRSVMAEQLFRKIPQDAGRADVEVRSAGMAAADGMASPPEALKALHAMMRSALQLATSACRLRRDAATRGDMAIAWNASSAAAGSLMLFGRAVEDLDRSLKPPQLQ